MTHLINLIIPLFLLATLSLIALTLGQRLGVISLKKLKFNLFATFVIVTVLLSGFTFPTVGEAGAKESQGGKAPRTRTRKIKKDSKRNQTQTSNRINYYLDENEQ